MEQKKFDTLEIEISDRNIMHFKSLTLLCYLKVRDSYIVS